MMKKIFILAVISALLCSCGIKEMKKAEDSDRLNVIATVFPAYDLARQIAGSSADVHMLIPPGTEVHSFEPTPQDIIRIKNADIFIFGGGESDEWIEGVLENSENSKLKTVRMIDSVSLIKTHHEHEENEHHDEFDEHVWTSPENAEKILTDISSVMCEADPKSSDVYTKNTESYSKQLTALDAEFRNVVNNAKRKSIVFADRFPLIYFAQEYGLDYYSAFSGCSENVQVSAATVASLIDKVKNEQIPVVFYIEFSDQRLADTICGETGAKKMQFNTCHNVEKKDIEKSYVDLMQENVTALQEALN